MAKSLFSVPIFFIAFRETLEAAIIVSVLLGLAEQIVYEDTDRLLPTHTVSTGDEKSESPTADMSISADGEIQRRHFRGAGIGLFVALAIGAAFIAIWFTQASNLWANTEELWEGIFDIIASIMIFVMGVSMLKMDRAKAKWRLKLQKAFDGRTKGDKDGKTVAGTIPLLLMVKCPNNTGLEAVVFIGGVSLGQPATAIPIAAIVGLICGLVVGFLIYQFGSRTTLNVFLIAMTNLLLLIGAGLFSRGVWAFQENNFNHLLGADVDDAGGDGPGSFNVKGNVWHLDCCNPEDNLDNSGWSIFNAIFGWTNSATLGSVLSYVAYWIAVVVVLVWMKFKEGRTTRFSDMNLLLAVLVVFRREKAAVQGIETNHGGIRGTDSKTDSDSGAIASSSG
ncbi:hypothetical protein D9757_015080 [Collybiopsis confluens]|uniref:Iron permease FTR1 n=1 Tax=Collybiopsis confluens TaxID=2823264 RepID=A0A8H5C8L9_9AGAR|nr:hypothetical protein D9757_015080 [Collybiopsis confluens]